MDSWSLRGENLVGIGTDGANVMCRENHSLVKLLRRTWPHIIHIMCVPFHWPHRQASHEIFNSQSCWILHPWVLQLVCPQPTTPSVLSRNSSPHWVFNWLWRRRRSGGCQQFTRWNCWKESSKAAIPIWHTMACYCWLHRENFRPIWCFENPFLAYSNERCYQAKILHEMFCDEKNYLFLLFLHPILKELKRLTKLFQSNSADFLRVFLDLESAFLAFGRRILKPAVMSSNNTTNLAELNIDSDFCLLEPGSVDLGSSFLQMLERSSLTSSEKLDMKMRGKNFLKEIFQGFQKRLRGSFHLLKKIDIFSYENFMKSTLVEQNFLPPFFPTDKPTLAEIEQKSKLLQASTFPAKETDLFWADVHFHQDSSGNFPFRPLSTGKNLNE